ncbi:molybdopterin-guanine dinucleotide biosynthesis protein B [Virgibacillus sp. SK37]|uniref:molybdopterin-guanine dinucleotide biosynthesis protein B n=1 Tax=Virgibacillus sp. SK37 TaxID=403957 RepID=UPI0004D0E0E2|nr:molybdopterin-guanine dinucleotide biosynthesis protein B [Virgibacillus sp. SK37]AIF42755.1 molybdopterin-guanine dinucleotide biosynthesis protein MobB [Virgibacillus sp. SK37]
MNYQKSVLPICQIIGYKNAGKTTLMEQLIGYFTSRQWKVGAIKHHGHGGEPDYQPGTDSQRHYEAGATISGVQGESQLQLTLRDDGSLENVLDFYRLLDLDMLFMEGYKKEDYPKIVILKDEKDVELLNLSNVIAVGLWNNEMRAFTKYPTFSMHKIEQSLSQLATVITTHLDFKC